jgi:hypothetical protein
MGAFYFSVHFKTADAEAVRGAVQGVVCEAGGRALVARPVGGWVNVYPSAEMGDPGVVEQMAAASGVEHVVALLVHDNSVMMYWYLRGGELADHFNSAPDYFGETDEEAMGAVGDPAAFGAIVDETGRGRLAELIGVRMINGEFVGRDGEVVAEEAGFVLEEERLEGLAGVLGIVGVVGCYEYLMDGEDVEGVGGKRGMVEVG